MEERRMLTTIDLGALTAAQGTTIFGADAGDRSGFSASNAGDVNGDGFDDLLIGARSADASRNNKYSAGESYVIFGGDFTGSVTHAGTAAAETLTGTTGADVIVGGLDDDTLIGSGGADVLRGGEGNDTLAISDLSFQRIVGGTGTDTLRIEGSALTLDLTSLADNRILGVEQIDITGSGDNMLTLDQQEVLNISDESNTLIVRRDFGDTVNIGNGWTQGANETIGPDTFEVFTQGQAVLKVLSLNVTAQRTFVVNTTLDTIDANPGDGFAVNVSGMTSLRAAIQEANELANLAGGPDTIAFAISGAGPHIITPTSALPQNTDPVIIAGTSEPDYFGAPVVAIDGSLAVSPTGAKVSGFDVRASGSEIHGLAIHNFSGDGIILANSHDSYVVGNYIGLDVNGDEAGNSRHGVRIVNSSSNVLDGNIISGNTQAGVLIQSTTATDNSLLNNRIGTDPNGELPRPNGLHGVYIIDPPGNFIGAAGQGNLISANANTGIRIVGDTATGTTIQGNYIGVNAAGDAALGNGGQGVRIRTSSNLIGGSLPGERNLISGNGANGIFIAGNVLTPADNNVVQGNLIGVDSSGSNALQNGVYGVYISGGSNNSVGGSAPDAGNLISGNFAGGVVIVNSQGTQLVGNTIGTDSTGQTEITNRSGVQVLAGSSNTLLQDNLISGNTQSGVLINNPTTTTTTLYGNLIGVTRNQDAVLDNGQFSVLVRSPGNTIGGLGAGQGNVISGSDSGVSLILTHANNTIAGNLFTNSIRGVRSFTGGNGNQITQNSMVGNTFMGIDLVSSGPNANDFEDADEGANRGQNKATSLAVNVTDQGANQQVDFNFTVDSVSPNSTYPLTIEFFFSNAAGEGIYYLDEMTVDAPGSYPFSQTYATTSFPFFPTHGTATVTDAAGNTSEFSAAVPITYSGGASSEPLSLLPPTPAVVYDQMDVNQDRNVTALDALIVINALNSIDGQGEFAAANNNRSHLDVNGDGRVSAVDALHVINRLNASDEVATAGLVDVALTQLEDDEVRLDDELLDSLLF